MEVTATRRPFLYVPLQRHLEQHFHVRHRLGGYGAGRCLTYPEATDPDSLAAAIDSQIDAAVDYRPVEVRRRRARRALLAELI